jgi:hypothetical protein
LLAYGKYIHVEEVADIQGLVRSMSNYENAKIVDAFSNTQHIWSILPWKINPQGRNGGSRGRY